jgi:hypothetical protein
MQSRNRRTGSAALETIILLALVVLLFAALFSLGVRACVAFFGVASNTLGGPHL